MTTPDEATGPDRESRVPDTGRPERDFPDTTTPATLPGLVVTEERLPDGRRITYFGTTR